MIGVVSAFAISGMIHPSCASAADDVPSQVSEYLETIKPFFTSVEYSNAKVYGDGIMIMDGYLTFLSESGNSVLYLRPGQPHHLDFDSPFDGEPYKPVLKGKEVTYDAYYEIVEPEHVYESPDKKIVMAYRGTDFPGRITSPVDHYQTLLPRVDAAEVVGEVPAGNEMNARLDYSERYRTHSSSDLSSGAPTDHLSPLIEVRIKLPGELIRISGNDISRLAPNTLVAEKKYGYRISRDEQIHIELEELSRPNDPLAAIVIPCAKSDKSRDGLLAKGFGFYGKLREGDTFGFRPDEDIKVIVITDEYIRRFPEHYKFEMHAHEHRITWGIPYKLYPLKILMPGMEQVEWKIVNDRHGELADILPDYFPNEPFYHSREEIFGPPPKATPPTDANPNDGAPFKLYVVYSASMIGYNDKDRQRTKYCKRHNIIVAFDKDRKEKSFLCPVDGEPMK